MAPNIKGCLWALAQEVLPAFRRGVVAVTALAYILLAGAYILVGGSFALSTFQLWTGALVIAIAEVLVVLPYRLWKANVTEINTLKSIDYTGPDWTIRELFYHIMPPDEIMKGENYRKVGLEVQDKLAAGQLLAWGRRVRGRPLQPIGLQFWAQADFTFWFLGDHGNDAEHAKSHSLLTEDEAYSDIRVNKGAASRIWPR